MVTKEEAPSQWSQFEDESVVPTRMSTPADVKLGLSQPDHSVRNKGTQKHAAKSQSTQKQMTLLSRGSQHRRGFGHRTLPPASKSVKSQKRPSVSQETDEVLMTVKDKMPYDARATVSDRRFVSFLKQNAKFLAQKAAKRLGTDDATTLVSPTKRAMPAAMPPFHNKLVNRIQKPKLKDASADFPHCSTVDIDALFATVEHTGSYSHAVDRSLEHQACALVMKQVEIPPPTVHPSTSRMEPQTEDVNHNFEPQTFIEVPLVGSFTKSAEAPTLRLGPVTHSNHWDQAPTLRQEPIDDCHSQSPVIRPRSTPSYVGQESVARAEAISNSTFISKMTEECTTIPLTEETPFKHHSPSRPGTTLHHKNRSPSASNRQLKVKRRSLSCDVSNRRLATPSQRRQLEEGSGTPIKAQAMEFNLQEATDGHKHDQSYQCHSKPASGNFSERNSISHILFVNFGVAFSRSSSVLGRLHTHLKRLEPTIQCHTLWTADVEVALFDDDGNACPVKLVDWAAVNASQFDAIIYDVCTAMLWAMELLITAAALIFRLS